MTFLLGQAVCEAHSRWPRWGYVRGETPTGRLRVEWQGRFAPRQTGDWRVIRWDDGLTSAVAEKNLRPFTEEGSE